MAKDDITLESSDPYLLVSGGIAEAVKLKLINHSAAYLHAQIRLWMNKAHNDVSWAGLPTLAEETGLSESSVKRHLKALEKLGFVHRIKRPGTTDLIRAVDRPDVWFDAWGNKPESVKKAAQKWLELTQVNLTPPPSTQVNLTSHPGQFDPSTQVNLTYNKKDIYKKEDKKEGRARLQVASDEATSNDPPTETVAEKKPEAAALARHLEHKIHEHIRTYGLSFSEPNCTDTWIADIDKLIRLGTTDPDVKSEPVEPEKVRRVIDKLFEWFAEPTGNNDFCWANNIRSPKKLRQQWPKLVADLETERRRRAGGNRPRPKPPTGNKFADMPSDQKNDLAQQIANELRARKGKPTSGRSDPAETKQLVAGGAA